MIVFRRGQVFEGNIPEFNYHKDVTPPPGFVLHGKHRMVMLHHYDFPGIDQRIALIAPITSAKAEITRAIQEGRSILQSYVPLEQADYSFLSNDSYISVSQVTPINRKWLIQGSPIGEIAIEKMVEVDIIIMRTFGLQETLMNLVAEKVQQELAKLGIDLSSGDVAAASE